MSKKEKALRKFLKNPASFRYQQIESLLFSIGFQKIPAKGSHMKFKHSKLAEDLIIPIHNNDCKDFYKKMVATTCSRILRSE